MIPLIYPGPPCDLRDGCEDIKKPAYIVAVSPYYLNITLFQGWNLVSVPVTPEPGSDTMDILSMVDTAGHSIFSWNSSSGSWTRLARTDKISPLSAFFVYSPDMVQVPVRISGQGPLYNLSRELDAGWNLVSFADVMMVSADEAFRSIEGLWRYYRGMMQIATVCCPGYKWITVAMLYLIQGRH